MRDTPGITAGERNSSICQVMRLGAQSEGRGETGSGLPASGAGAERQTGQRWREKTAWEIAALIFLFLPVSSPSSLF